MSSQNPGLTGILTSMHVAAMSSVHSWQGPVPISEVWRAPDEPGLYTWYANILIGDGDASSTADLLRVLSAYSSMFSEHPLEIEADHAFGMRWRGQIDRNSPEITALDDYFNRLDGDGRRLIIKTIRSAQPLFSRPLYIGKATKSLKSRLKTHSETFFNTKSITYTNAITNDEIAEIDFAHRAAKFGFRPDELVCFFLPITNFDLNDIETSQIEAAIGISELFLNRWATPPLGRR